ncbi:OadG family protein [Clostridium sp.]|uniref:OadG family protein n=1 Tax=Clostridium sp. TaxID=1506 RepID=UPI003D6C8BE3
MSIANSLLVALILMSVVFSCLVALSFLLKAQAFVFSFIDNNKKNQKSKEEVASDIDSSQNNIEVSTGELKLIGVDEKTTAIIMAILSDELEISLCELQFKSIKLIN